MTIEQAVVGNRGVIEINPRNLMKNEASIVGVQLAGSTSEEAAEAAAALAAGLADGTLSPVVGQVFPLAAAPQAHAEVLAHTGGTNGKLVIQPWEE